MTLSPGASIIFKSRRKMVMSGYFPAINGPLIHTISPPSIDTATSYRRPALLNLWEYHSFEKGWASWTMKSVPSTETLQMFAVDGTNRLSQRISSPSRLLISSIIRQNQIPSRTRGLLWVVFCFTIQICQPTDPRRVRLVTVKRLRSLTHDGLVKDLRENLLIEIQ